jgi:hypothetical protein
MMSSEKRPLTLVTPSGKSNATLEISLEAPWLLKLVCDDEVFEAQEFDVFESLIAIRRQLEPMNWVLCCAGARADVWPSGMSRDMGGGRRAYVHVAGRRPSFEDLVDIFDPADCGDVVSVDAQKLSIKELRG